MKIAHLDYNNWSPAQLAGLAQYGEIVDASHWNQTDLLAHLTNYDGLIIGLSVRIDKEVIDRATKLQFVATATTGLTHLDVGLLAERKIPLLSLAKVTDKLSNVTGTAEIALGLLIALARVMPAAITSVHQGVWQRPAGPGHELSSKTLGIIGYGRLGRWMGRYGLALGMTVLANDPFLEDQDFPEEIERVELTNLLERADSISVHASLNKTSENLINTKAFKSMKPTAYLVNTARGEIVDEAALLSALTDGHLAGAGLDVLRGEEQFLDHPDQINHPLIAYARNHANLLLTPHLGGWTLEGTYKARGVLLEVISEYFTKNHDHA